MSIGISVRDSSGQVIFDDQHLTMRVLRIVKVRDSAIRSRAMDITVPEARAKGVVAMVLPHQNAYTEGYHIYQGSSHLGLMPIVTVHDGYIRLAPFDGLSVESVGYRAAIDIALVSLG